MDYLIKLLDKNLNYIKHEVKDSTIYIDIESNLNKCRCPYCRNFSSRVHSRYTRTFQDLPIYGYKSIIILHNKKFFCNNINCSKTTFSQKFEFIKDKAKRTNRLDSEIISFSQKLSSISVSKLI